MNKNLLLQMMGLFKPEEAEASASGTALRKAMTKKEIEAYNTVPTRSELPFDQAYSPELKDPKKYNAKVKEGKKKQAIIDQAALEYKARMDAAKAVEDSQVKVPDYTAVPNMEEAMNPTTSRNAQKRLEAANIRAGGKESFSGSQNNTMSAAESARLAEQVNDVADRFNVDEFDKRVTVPELEAIKKKYAEQIAGLDQEQDKTADLISILAASGKDPSKIDLNKFYKFDSKDKATALREKLRALTNDQSKALGDTAKLKLTAFAAMKLPNTNFSTSAGQQYAPRAGGSGAGAGKPPTNNELKDYGEGYGKILKIKSQEKRLMQIADGVDQDILKAYSVSAGGASALNTLKGWNPLDKKASGRAAVTEEALSILADIMMNYQLELSGKAATDKEAAKIMLASGISLGASQGGTKQGIANVLNDFKRQLALPLAGRKTTLKQMFDEESGLDSTNDVKTILQGVQGNRIQQVAPPTQPSAGGSGMSPEARRARIQELKAKKAAGTIK